MYSTWCLPTRYLLAIVRLPWFYLNPSHCRPEPNTLWPPRGRPPKFRMLPAAWGEDEKERARIRVNIYIEFRWTWVHIRY